MEGVEIGNITIPAIKGDKGDKGDAGKIISLSVTMLASTATPTVTNTGTESEAQYILGIPRGTGVSSAVINENGELVITLSDNTELNLGVIMPNSIASVSMTEDYDFVVTLTDGTETTVGNISDEIQDLIDTALADYYDKDETNAQITALGNYLLPIIGRYINLSIDASTYVLTATLKNNTNTAISTSSIDLPLESMVVSGSYDSANKKVVLTLQNGNTVEFSVADLVAGLQSEITSSNKLSADLVDDTSTTHKFVTSSEKTQITTNATAITNIKDGTTIDSFGDVETALSGKQSTSNLVTSLSSSSTDTQYPSAKCVYDLIGDINTALDLINGEVI